jgi:hypothetical protein
MNSNDRRIITDYLTTQQAADFMQLHPGTLANWRKGGQGPSYIRLGRTIRYQMKDIQHWLDALPREGGPHV